jgi:Mrr N-terminal domain
VERDVSEELDEATADPGVAAGIPQFFDLFRPLLEVLADGSDWKLPDAAEVVADAIGVGEEARTLRLRSGRLLFENRIRWAFTCLSKAELAELVGPSTVRITNDGRAVVQTEARIDRDFLLQTRPTYAAWHVDMGIEEPRPAEGEAAGGVWMVRAGRGGVYAPQFVTKSAAIVGWGETGDVSGLPREAIADRVSEAFPGDGARQRGQATNTLYHVVDSMQSGDLVVTPEPASRTLLLGRVSGPYQYLDDPPAPSYSHAREVRWFARVSRDELSYGARNSLGSMLTLSRPGHQGELLRLAENHADDGSPEPLEQTRRASPEPEPVLVPVAIPATASVPKRTALAEFQTFPRRVMQMLDQLHSGEISLPDFQRSFVWAPDATRELIVSLIRGFPAGNLLFLQGGSARFKARTAEEAPASQLQPS